MSEGVRYRDRQRAAQLRALLLYYAADAQRGGQLDRYTRAVLEYLREQLTARELECMEHYYVRRRNLEAIAAELGIVPSTVSRSIRRGEKKLDDLLRLAVEISPLRLPPVLDIRPAGEDRG